MRRLFWVVLLSGAPLLLAAQPPEKPQPDAAFAALDKNGDGYLSRAEAKADREIAKRFDRFDANKDARLSEEEWRRAADDYQKQVLADTGITTKVKAQLLAAKGIPSMSISVTTYEGRVQLSGFVESGEQVSRAGRIAAGVSGVKSVQNNLAVK